MQTRFKFSLVFRKAPWFIKLSSIMDVSKCLFQYLRIEKSPISLVENTMIQKANTVIEIATLLKPLCSSIILESKYAYNMAGLETGYIGLGTWNTWHGSSDM